MAPVDRQQPVVGHLTLHAALSELSSGRDDAPINGGSSPEVSRALAAWRRSVAEHEPEQWVRRLSWDGLDERLAGIAVGRCLKAPAHSPAWTSTIRGLRSAMTSRSLAQVQPSAAPAGAREAVAFQEIWHPVVDWALERLRSSLGALAAEQLRSAAWESVGHALLRRLSAVSECVLLDAFNRHRSLEILIGAYQSVGASVDGQLPKSCYESFVKQSLETSLFDVFAEFPVLARHVSTTIDHWHAAMSEFLDRVTRDRVLLEANFGIGANAVVSDLTFGLSDPHHGGRVVAIVDFDVAPGSSHASRLVYKPKDMRLEAAYQRAICTLPVAPGQAPLRSLRVLALDRYGYMEFLSHRPASDDPERERFYVNAGRLTAILYLLGCTDCHHENLVAHGDQLVLIDTETLFEPKLRDLVNEASPQPQHRTPGQMRLAGAVTRSGLLPSWEFMGEASRAVDISALGAESPSGPTQLASGWIGVNTDGMMAGMVERPAEVPTSLPHGIGQPNRFTDFVDSFCAGFRGELSHVINSRAEWTKYGGILDSFGGVSRRIVIRPTQSYFKILRRLVEPEALRSEAAQGFVLEQLSLAFLPATVRPGHWDVFRAEVIDVSSLDVPVFEHCVDSTVLDLPRGTGIVTGLIDKSGLLASRERVRDLDCGDIDLQERLIRGVTAARWIRVDELADLPASASVDAVSLRGECAIGVGDGSELAASVRLREAQRLAGNLRRDALSIEAGHAEWLGLSLGDDGSRMSYGLLGPTVYSGTSGVSLFLACLGTANLPIARACVDATRRLALTGHDGLLWRWWRDQPLGLNGCGGIILALQLLGELDEPESRLYSDAVDRLISALRPERIMSDVEFDIMSGCAGLLGCLLRHRTPEALNLARAAGDHVLAGQGSNGGWALSNGYCYTGFAHGSAGICAALSSLYASTKDGRLPSAILRALDFERARFVSEEANWRRFADDPSPPRTAWCHGAPGIALSKMCLIRDLETAAAIKPQTLVRLREDLALALDTTAAFVSPAQLDHLCCGNFGRSVVLRIAGRHADADRIEARAIVIAARQGGLYGYGQTARVDTPSLFRGSAGVGLALLRAPCSAAVMSAGLLP